jgi:signal transduction histidine kinase
MSDTRLPRGNPRFPPSQEAADDGHLDNFEGAKLAALAEFAAGAGHEINNPLATISGRVQLLLRTESDPERRRALATIGGQAARIRDMIGDLMLFARPPVPAPRQLDLNEVVGDVAVALADKLAESDCRLKVETNGRPEIWADRGQLEVVISCLLQNSIEASARRGVIRVALQAIQDGDQAMALFRVSDEGCGIDDRVRDHLFDPFFSGRPAGRGLGFGLSKCWRIVTNHGGKISVASAPGGATTFEVTWPAGCRPH